MSVTITRTTVSAIQAAPELVAEYAAESRMAELGEPCPQFDTYLAMERALLIHPVGAFEDGRMVGFIQPLVARLPHYGVLAATVESYFVRQAYRPRGVGLALLDYAEDMAKDMGARALLVSAPEGSQLAQVLALRKRYRQSNAVFVTAL